MNRASYGSHNKYLQGNLPFKIRKKSAASKGVHAAQSMIPFPGIFATDKSGLSSPMHCLVFEILFMAIHPKAGGNVDKKKL